MSKLRLTSMDLLEKWRSSRTKEFCDWLLKQEDLTSDDRQDLALIIETQDLYIKGQGTLEAIARYGSSGPNRKLAKEHLLLLDWAYSEIKKYAKSKEKSFPTKKEFLSRYADAFGYASVRSLESAISRARTKKKK